MNTPPGRRRRTRRPAPRPCLAIQLRSRGSGRSTSGRRRFSSSTYAVAYPRPPGHSPCLSASIFAPVGSAPHTGYLMHHSLHAASRTGRRSLTGPVWPAAPHAGRFLSESPGRHPGACRIHFRTRPAVRVRARDSSIPCSFAFLDATLRRTQGW